MNMEYVVVDLIVRSRRDEVVAAGTHTTLVLNDGASSNVLADITLCLRHHAPQVAAGDRVRLTIESGESFGGNDGAHGTGDGDNGNKL